MFKKIIIFILLLTSLICIGINIYSNIFPVIYLLTFILGILFLDLIGLFLIKRKNKILSIIGYTLSIIFIILFIILSFIFIKVQIVFSKVSNIDNEVSNYSLVVLKDSNYYNINDVIDKTIGVLSTDNSYYNKALNELKENITFKYSKYENEYLLANGLLEKNVEAILINEAYIAILDEGIKDFSNNVRILEEATVEVEIEKEIKDSDTKEEEKVVNNNEAFNLYISGIDTYGNISSVSRSDVNIIATINPTTSEILLTNVPRDMYVDLYGKSGLKDKLTHAGVYGINTSVGTLENFLDIDIDYYVRINFNSLIKIVDYIGGIDIYSEYAFRAGDRYFVSGMNYDLTGKEALYFSRNRYAFKDGDRQRGRNQEQVIAGIINKITASKDINIYYNLINTLENSFQTNIDREFINKFISNQLKNNYNWNILFSDVNGFGSSNYTYSYPWQKLYVMEVDYNSLESAKSKIYDVLNNN